MNNLFILLITLLLSSCVLNNPRIEIYNETKEVLTEVEFGIAHGLIEEVDSLQVDDSHSSKIIFDDNVKGDGGYVFKYKINNLPYTHAFGYFTNGKSMNRLIIIKVELDTINYLYY